MAAVPGGVSHVMLGVADLDRSLAFWAGTLGRAVRFQAPGLALLDGGGVAIGLSLELGRARQPLAAATEVVFGVDAVRPAWRALAGAGAAVVREPRQVTDREWAATLADPDGHWVTLFGPPGD